MQIIFLFVLTLLYNFNAPSYRLTNNQLPNGWYYITEENKGVQFKLDKTDKYYYLDTVPIVVSKNIKEISIQKGRDGNPYLKMQFNSIGTKAWKFATMRSINKKLGFVFKNKLIQCPTVYSEIEGGIAAIWDYSKEELTFIKSTLESERNKSH